jgi:3D (Asp-Asp-Asp) domain-containing protein
MIKEINKTVSIVLYFTALALLIAGIAVIPNKPPIQAEIAPEATTEPPDPCLMPHVYCETDLVEVTAYSEYDSCHTGESCLMASGKKAYVGAVACPREIELGTKVIIAGIEYTCEDRTSPTYDGRYDIFMGYSQEGYDKAVDWGLQELEIIIN